MELSKKNAQALWAWKGEKELEEIKSEIRDLKKRIQSLANKLASKKGLSDQRLNLLVTLAKTLEERRKYLHHIYDIKDMAI
jgi:archaellum component FlaC